MCCLKSGLRITDGLLIRQVGGGLGNELKECTAQTQTAC